MPYPGTYRDRARGVQHAFWEPHFIALGAVADDRDQISVEFNAERHRPSLWQHQLFRNSPFRSPPDGQTVPVHCQVLELKSIARCQAAVVTEDRCIQIDRKSTRLNSSHLGISYA